MDTIAVGNAGQRYAEHFLRQKGYKFIARNWRAKFGEIDIIYRKPRQYGSFFSLFASAPQELVFVEVKALIKQSDAFRPEDHLNFAKQRKLRRLAHAYVSYKELGEIGYQIDLVAIDLDKNLNLVDIRHYPKAIQDNF